LNNVSECFKDPKVGVRCCLIKNLDGNLQYLGYLGSSGHTLAIGRELESTVYKT